MNTMLRFFKGGGNLSVITGSMFLLLCLFVSINTGRSAENNFSSLTFQNDMALDSIVSPLSPACPGTYSIAVKIRNTGSTMLTSALINWSLNGVSQPVFNWTGNLPSGASMVISLGTYSFVTGLYAIHAIASLPNGVSDPTPNDNTKTKQIIINQTAVILVQPVDDSISCGGSALFFVHTSGTVVGYQWQVSTNGGTTWTNITNNSMYSGVTNDTLIVTPSYAMNSYRYRCVVSGCSTSLNSTSAELIISQLVHCWIDPIYTCTCYTPPVDILVPVKVSCFTGINSVSVSMVFNNLALQYTGYQNPNPALQFPIINDTPAGNPNTIRIASFTTFGTMNIPDNDALVVLKFKVLCDTAKIQFETWTPGACQFSGGPDTAIFIVPSVFGDGLILDGGPVVTTQPVNETVYVGDTAVFSCSGMTYNSTSTYQWQVSTNGGSTWVNLTNGAPYTGVTTTTLSVIGATLNMNGYKYRCHITGLCDPVNTNDALLTVTLAPFQVILGNVNLCQGSPLIVPVIFSGNDSVYGFNLVVNLGNSATYLSYQNISPLLGAGTITVTPVGSSLQINWFSIVPAIIAGTETMMELILSASQTSSSFQLLWDVNVCSLSSLSSGVITASYINSTVSVNPVPALHNVITPSPANGHFCAGGPGVQIGLDLTEVGVNYTLYRDGVIVAGYNAVPGTGFGLSFSTFSIPGVYTVIAFFPGTSCSSAMNFSVTAVADQPPIAFNVTGGGAYCAGGSGFPVGLSASQSGVVYYLYLNGSPIDTLAGNGNALSFGNQLAAGTYNIYGGNGLYETCPTSMNGSASILITAPPTAAINYVGSPYCISQQTPHAVTLSGTNAFTGGTYSGAPAGLTLNTTTGAVTPSTSTPGTYTVTYTLPANGGCAAVVATATVVITPLPTASIHYAGTPFCNTINTDQPITLTGTNSYTGGTFSSSPGLTLDPVTGALTPSTSMGGTYTITYTIAAAGGCSAVTATTQVQITPLPTATIHYAGSPFCSTTGSGSVTLTGTNGYTVGTFSSSPGLSINTSTGHIIPSTSTPGSYTVTYTLAAAAGCAAVTATTTVVILPLPAAAGAITGNTTPCQGATLVYTCAPITNATSYTWTLPTGVTGTSTTNSITVTFTNNAISGNITVAGQNSCGAGQAASLPLNIQPLPGAAGIISGAVHVCKGANYTYTLPSIVGATSYTWTLPNGFTGNSPINSITLSVGLTAVSGNLTVQGHNACGDGVMSNLFIVVDTCVSLEGIVSYQNTASTPLNNTQLTLYHNNTQINQISSDLNGAYQFNFLTHGDYTVYPLTLKPWGGANASDALKILKYFVGIETLSGLPKRGADVDGSGVANSADALMVARRFVGQINSFNAGDWLFDRDTIHIIGSTTITHDIHGLCYGDVDCSYVPAPKLEPGISLLQSGEIQYDGSNIIEIPLYLQHASAINSVSLVLKTADPLLRIKDISSPNEGVLVYKQLQDEIRIAWYSINSIEPESESLLFSLLVEVSDNQINTLISREWLSLGSESIMTDFNGGSLSNLLLTYPKITQQKNELVLGQNLPNPFIGATTIPYYLPENGRVVLEVFDVLGRRLMSLVDGVQSAGQHTVNLKDTELYPGLYTYRLSFSGSSVNATVSKNLIIQK